MQPYAATCFAPETETIFYHNQLCNIKMHGSISIYCSYSMLLYLPNATVLYSTFLSPHITLSLLSLIVILHILRIILQRYPWPEVFIPIRGIGRLQVSHIIQTTPVIIVEVVILDIQLRIVISRGIVPPVSTRRIQIGLSSVRPQIVRRVPWHTVEPPIQPIVVPSTPFVEIWTPRWILAGPTTLPVQIRHRADPSDRVQMRGPGPVP